MGQRVAGVVNIAAAGMFISAKGSVTVKHALKREGLAGPNGAVGYKETYEVPYIEVEAFAVPDLDVQKIEALKDATVQVDAANGHTFILRGAWCTGEVEHDVVEGTLKFKFEGMDLKEIKA